ERQMRFSPCQRNLALLAKGQDVVSENVLLAIVLMDTAVFYIVDKVVFEENSRAAFIRVQTPTAVASCIDIMANIVSHHRPFRGTQRINPAHITQDPIAKVMEMIVFNAIPLRRAFIVTPAPTHRDGCVKEIADITVGNDIIRALPNPPTDCMRHDSAAAL